MVVVLACIVAAVVVAVVWPREHEPEYEGKKLSEWLMGERPLGEPANARAKAIHQIGTNALPFLLRWIRYETPPWRKKLSSAIRKINTKAWVAFRDKKADRAKGARLGFEILGPQASPAIPELTKLMKGTNVDITINAFYALHATGIEALPVLLEVLTNGPACLRLHTAVIFRTMRQLGTNASVVVPVLIEQLQDKDPEVAAKAAAMLGVLGVEPALAVPALTSSLLASETYVRCSAVYALARFGDQARSAVPSLLRALDDSDRSVREAATNALRQIAPEVFGKEGGHANF